jgi:hypothetical protein
MEQPHIHFIDATTFQECEKKVNDWVDTLPFLCTVINVNVIPMIMEGKLVFLTVVMYTGQPKYAPQPGG